MPDRRVHQSFAVIRRRLPEPALDYHSAAIAETPVAGRAVNVKASLAALDILFGNWDRELIDILPCDFPGITGFVEAELPPGDGALYFRTGRAMISEEYACRQGFIARFVMHVVAACRQTQQQQRTPRDDNPISQLQPPLRDSFARGTPRFAHGRTWGRPPQYTKRTGQSKRARQTIAR